MMNITTNKAVNSIKAHIDSQVSNVDENHSGGFAKISLLMIVMPSNSISLANFLKVGSRSIYPTLSKKIEK